MHLQYQQHIVQPKSNDENNKMIHFLHCSLYFYLHHFLTTIQQLLNIHKNLPNAMESTCKFQFHQNKHNYLPTTNVLLFIVSSNTYTLYEKICFNTKFTHTSDYKCSKNDEKKYVHLFHECFVLVSTNF